LAAELEKIGQQLDAGNFSDSLSIIEDDNVIHHQQSAEEIGKERCHLVGLWEGLVERVKKLPQFKYFLKPVPFDQLCQACATGHTIVINASQYGVDVLVFNATQAINHVPLPNIDLKELVELFNKILLQQPVVVTKKTQRSYTAHHLMPALRTIWNNIIVPIFNKLDVPLKHSAATSQQRRIWWYFTKPLTFIPIHAAGPGHKGTIDVNHLTISSYITSLDLLLQL
jgi:hypothetical protein